VSNYDQDLLVDPKTRGTEDIIHRIVAVGSRSVPSAQSFISTVCSSAPNDIKAYGTYDEVFSDPDVHAIYIGTPHTLHYPSALAALKAKKAVLCEKPVTSTKAELEELLRVAKENNTFFMEAMWTRFQPALEDVLKVLKEGKIGKPVVVQGDLSGDFDVDSKLQTSLRDFVLTLLGTLDIPTSHRILDPKLGGGALLDLGPYPLVWALSALYLHPSNKGAPPDLIVGSMLKNKRTGVDANTSFTLHFNQLEAQAILTCSINLDAVESPGVLIRCEKGTIEIHKPIYCPKKVVVRPKGGEAQVSEYEYTGGGWHFQADEVARSVREGKIESDKWTWELSKTEMGIFDEVRKQGGYTFPEGVEWVK